MFNLGAIARPLIIAASGPYVAAVNTSLGGTGTQTLARAFSLSTDTILTGDLVLFASCCHWDSVMNQLDSTSRIVATAGNTSSGIAWRAAVAGFDYDSGSGDFGSQLRVQAPGITAGLYGTLIAVRDANLGAFHDSSVKYHTGSGFATPTFNSLDVLAGGLVLAITFMGDDSASLVNQGPDTNWTREFNAGSASGTDGRIVVDAFSPTANATITPQSPRSNGMSPMWATIAVSIAPP